MMTVDSKKDLTAIGRLAGRLGCDVDTLLAAAERLKIKPAMRVDRVVFFDRDAAERLRSWQRLEPFAATSDQNIGAKKS